MLGIVGVILWSLLLGLGLWALLSTKRPRRSVWRLASLLGQLGLHTLYGDETFLYSLHFLPLLITVAALSTLTHLRVPAGNSARAHTSCWRQQLAAIPRGHRPRRLSQTRRQNACRRVRRIHGLAASDMSCWLSLELRKPRSPITSRAATSVPVGTFGISFGSQTPGETNSDQ